MKIKEILKEHMSDLCSDLFDEAYTMRVTLERVAALKELLALLPRRTKKYREIKSELSDEMHNLHRSMQRYDEIRDEFIRIKNAEVETDIAVPASCTDYLVGIIDVKFK